MLTAFIIKDDKVTFSLFRGQCTGHIVYQLSMDAMLYPEGFFWSASRNGNEMLDLFQGKQIDAKTLSDSAAILIDHTGCIYRAIRVGTRFVKHRIQYGKGAYAVISDSLELQQALSMAMHLTKQDVNKSIELVSKDIMIRPKTFITMNIQDIVKVLKERNFTKTCEMIQPFGPEPKKEKKDG